MPSRLRRYDEPGHAHFLTSSCFRRLQFFRHDSVKQVFVDTLKYVRDKHHVRWLGYVIMPEHVHLLVWPHPPGGEILVPISTILHDLKQYAGREGKDALRDTWRERRTLGSGPLDDWATGAGLKPFWKPRGYDFNVTTETTLREKLDYIHKNPITRGLVERAEDWPWSSYRFFELGDASVFALGWDGGWPIETSSR